MLRIQRRLGLLVGGGPYPGCVRLVELIGPRGMRVRAAVPISRRQRSKGLRGRSGLAPGEAMLFLRCRSVHTVGMRFTVTVVALDRFMGVRWVRAVAPGRVVRPRSGVRHMLELDAREQVRPGDRFRFDQGRPGRRRGEGPTALRPWRR